MEVKENILIIRMSAIGDIVMSSCLADGIKRRYPGAKVSWLVQHGMQSLVEANPNIDEVIVWPRAEWQKMWKNRQYLQLWKTVLQFKKQLKQHQFTIAIDAQGLMKSGVFAWLSGAPKRIGLNSREGSKYLMTEVINAPRSEEISSEYRFLLQTLGEQPQPSSMCFTAEDEAVATDLVNNLGIKRPYIVFCPFSTRVQKNWDDSQWSVLAEHIDKQLNMDCIILGAPADKPVASEMASQATSLYELAGKTALRQAAAVIENAKALVGVDTGLTHMGVLNYIPSVVLFGSTCPYTQTQSEVVSIIYHDLSCSPCRRRPTCDGRFECMRDITVDEVMERLQDLGINTP